MSYLLDTNVCIRFIRGLSVNITSNFQQVERSNIFVCSVVKAELAYGAYKSQQIKKNLDALGRFINQFESFSFDDEAAIVFGELRAYLAKRGELIGPYDLQIAAIALANNCTLVTHNVREFSRVPNLKFEDWEAAV